jgi:hypothetical protein
MSDHPTKKKSQPLSGIEQKKSSAASCLCGLSNASDTKNTKVLPSALNFALGCGAVLVAVDVALTGDGLGPADSDQRHEAGGRYNKTKEHAEGATLPPT